MPPGAPRWIIVEQKVGDPPTSAATWWQVGIFCVFSCIACAWDSSLPTNVRRSDPQNTFYFLTSKSHPRDLWPLRHLIRVMRRRDLTKKTKTFWEHLKRPLLETCDLWDIWSKTLKVMKRHDTTDKDIQRTQLQIHVKLLSFQTVENLEFMTIIVT